MFTIPELTANALGSHLAEHMHRRFGSTDAGLIERVESAARLAIDCIGNSDALYHNVEHTMLVTLVGYDILRGRQLLMETNASDFAHLIFACLFHDIGYVRGILKGDGADGYIVDAKGNKAEAVAELVRRRAIAVSHRPVKAVRDGSLRQDQRPRRHPRRERHRVHALSRQLMALTTATAKRACWYALPISSASLVIRLYLRKANALYYEFEEVGMNKQLGYTSPADLIDLYPKLLLEQRSIAYPWRHPLPQHHVERTKVGSPISTAISFAPNAS